MSASELLKSHATIIAERDVEIAQRTDRELRLKHEQRVASAIRQGRDPYSPIHPAFVGTNTGPVDAEIEASRKRASQAYGAQVIAPIVAQIRQADSRIEVLRVAAAEVWDRIEAEFPAKAEEIYVRSVNAARTEAAEVDAALTSLQVRVQRAHTAKADQERAAAQYAIDCAAALAAGRPLPEPPTPVAVEPLDDTMVAQARQTLLAQQPKARERLRVAEDYHRAFRLRSERRHAENLARELIERAKNLGVSPRVVFDALAARSEVRS